MRRYFSRLCWYVGLILVLVGFFYLPIPMVTLAFGSALACYFPGSLLWILQTRLYLRFLPEMRQDSERPGFIIMLVGALMVASCYFFPNIDWASLSILIILVGGDCVFSAREVQSLEAEKRSRVNKFLI